WTGEQLTPGRNDPCVSQHRTRTPEQDPGAGPRSRIPEQDPRAGHRSRTPEQDTRAAERRTNRRRAYPDGSSVGPRPTHSAPGPLTWPRARSLGPQHRFLAGQVVLRRRLEGAGHAVEPVRAVPVGIPGRAVLMPRLGRVVDAVAGLGERSQLRGDATATSCVERLLIAGHRLADDLALLGGGPVHGAAVLGAHVIALPHGGGGI